MSNFWLVKTEPDVYPIAQLKRDRKTLWDCVRNYQARNYLREMQKGELVLIYHSNSDPTGVVGLATVSKEAIPDPTQFDRKSEYFDPKATPGAPRWFAPELKFLEAFANCVSLEMLRADPKLAGMVLLQRGSRLSVQPVTAPQFSAILKIAGGRA